MELYLIDWDSDKLLLTRSREYTNVIPTKDSEVYYEGNHYRVISVIFDYKQNRVQVHIKKR